MPPTAALGTLLSTRQLLIQRTTWHPNRAPYFVYTFPGRTQIYGLESIEMKACSGYDRNASSFVDWYARVTNCAWIAGQLLRHYSPDLEVFRVMGATADGAGGHTGNGGEPTNLAEMAK